MCAAIIFPIISFLYHQKTYETEGSLLWSMTIQPVVQYPRDKHHGGLSPYSNYTSKVPTKRCIISKLSSHWF